MTDQSTGAEQPADSEQVAHNAERVRSLAKQEKEASRKLVLGGHMWALIIALVCAVVYVVSPVIGSVAGYEVLLNTQATVDARVTPVEVTYGWLMLLATGILTLLVLLTRRTAVAVTAWALSGISLVGALLSLWLRQTRSTATDGNDYRLAMYVSVLGVVISVVAYSIVIWRRSDEQREIKDQRMSSPNLDEVGYAQRQVNVAPQNPTFDTNPVFEDNRRQQAAQRHRRLQEPKD